MEPKDVTANHKKQSAQAVSQPIKLTDEPTNEPTIAINQPTESQHHNAKLGFRTTG